MERQLETLIETLHMHVSVDALKDILYMSMISLRCACCCIIFNKCRVEIPGVSYKTIDSLYFVIWFIKIIFNVKMECSNPACSLDPVTWCKPLVGFCHRFVS